MEICTSVECKNYTSATPSVCNDDPAMVAAIPAAPTTTTTASALPGVPATVPGTKGISSSGHVSTTRPRETEAVLSGPSGSREWSPPRVDVPM